MHRLSPDCDVPCSDYQLLPRDAVEQKNRGRKQAPAFQNSRTPQHPTSASWDVEEHGSTVAASERWLGNTRRGSQLKMWDSGSLLSAALSNGGVMAQQVKEIFYFPPRFTAITNRRGGGEPSQDNPRQLKTRQNKITQNKTRPNNPR